MDKIALFILANTEGEKENELTSSRTVYLQEHRWISTIYSLPANQTVFLFLCLKSHKDF